MTTALGEFGAPPDGVAWAALVAALVLWVVLGSRAAGRALTSDRAFVAIAALVAALLSAGYVVFYLRGGPRIVDATTYFLQARALSEGYVAMPVPVPSGNFRGRFLLPDAAGTAISGIFPPGYPAFLALGFLAGAPMLVGPVLAALLVWATFSLARRLFDDPAAARAAAAFSVLSAVLRYHTADTMSHGLSALLLASSLALALGDGRARATVSGLLVGWLVATRPLTGAVALAVIAYASRAAPRRLLLVGLAALPPVFLFLLQQRVATGRWFTSTQLAYYALADGPPGCFRYGFGAGIGCQFEHGDFVRARLEGGFGVLAAMGTTLRRLKMHLADAANLELFAPILVYGAVRAFRDGRSRIAVLAVVGVVAAYVPFYFDGNYPGGGARLYADALPLEHGLLAAALVRLGAIRVAVPMALVGFALHTSHDHRQLRAREGGRPMFEPAVVEAAGIRRGLLFVDTDHGFALARDPAVNRADVGLVVARRRRDAHDAVLWERLGRPAVWAYEFDPGRTQAVPRVVTATPPVAGALRFEAEAEWPPLRVAGGSAFPAFPACASAGRALAGVRLRGGPLELRLEVPVPRRASYDLRTGWVVPQDGRVEARVALAGSSFRISERGPAGECLTLAGSAVALQVGPEHLDITMESDAALDFVEIELVGSDPVPR